MLTYGYQMSLGSFITSFEYRDIVAITFLWAGNLKLAITAIPSGACEAGHVVGVGWGERKQICHRVH